MRGHRPPPTVQLEISGFRDLRCRNRPISKFSLRIHSEKILRQLRFNFEQAQVAILSRIRKIYCNPFEDPGRLDTHDQDLLRKKDRLTDAVRDKQDGLSRLLPDANEFLP